MQIKFDRICIQIFAGINVSNPPSNLFGGDLKCFVLGILQIFMFAYFYNGWGGGEKCGKHTHIEAVIRKTWVEDTEAISVLNQCLSSIVDWMCASKLKLNPEETEMLLIQQRADQGIGIVLLC